MSHKKTMMSHGLSMHVTPNTILGTGKPLCLCCQPQFWKVEALLHQIRKAKIISITDTHAVKTNKMTLLSRQE